MSRDYGAEIDLVSNHTIFTGADVIAHYTRLIAGEPVPIETVPTFLHEATHHWCFVSPLGEALSVLYLRIAQRALRWAVTGDETETSAVLDDLLVFETTLEWLKPLSEGLAQFAEYDLGIPTHPAFPPSPPLDATLRHLFALPQRLRTAKDGMAVLRDLSEELASHRMSARMIDKKAELFLGPLDPLRSPYFLGYLAVKQLWRNATRFCPDLGEPDVFLQFMRKVVFANGALIRCLVDRSSTAHARSAMFGRTLFETLQWVRLGMFDEPEDDEPEFDLATMLAEANPDDATFVADALFFGGDEAEDTLERLREEKITLLRVKASDVPPRFPLAFFADVLRERHLLWFGDVPATWRPRGAKLGDVLVGDRGLFELPLTESRADEIGAEISLDFYADMYRGWAVTTIRNARGVFAFRANTGIEPKHMKDLSALRLNRWQWNEIRQAIRPLVEQMKTGTPFAEVTKQFWDDGGAKLFAATYDGFAFDFDPTATEALRGKGIDALLETADRIRVAAAASLAASAGWDLQRLTRSFDPGIDVRRALTEIAAAWPAREFPLADVTPDGRLRTFF